MYLQISTHTATVLFTCNKRYTRTCICTEIVNGSGLNTLTVATFALSSTRSSAITPIRTGAFKIWGLLYSRKFLIDFIASLKPRPLILLWQQSRVYCFIPLFFLRRVTWVKLQRCWQIFAGSFSRQCNKFCQLLVIANGRGNKHSSIDGKCLQTLWRWPLPDFSSKLVYSWSTCIMVAGKITDTWFLVM